MNVTDYFTGAVASVAQHNRILAQKRILLILPVAGRAESFSVVGIDVGLSLDGREEAFPQAGLALRTEMGIMTCQAVHFLLPEGVGLPEMTVLNAAMAEVAELDAQCRDCGFDW
jgi:hypothetical protein